MAEDVKNQGFTPLEIIINANRKAKFLTGFTFIELLMVMVIVGILAVVTITRFESFSPIKLDGATKKAVSDIRYIQHLAVSMHVNQSINFNPASATYSSTAVDPFTRKPLNVNFTTDAQYKGIEIVSTNLDGDSLQFDWQGVPRDGSGTALTSNGIISLSYHDNASTIYITPNTGRVSVE